MRGRISPAAATTQHVSAKFQKQALNVIAPAMSAAFSRHSPSSFGPGSGHS
jgi:hypothetical protein